MTKRELVVCDQSGWQVRVTLWNRQAASFDGSDGKSIGIKGAKVGDFNGRSLSIGFDGTVQVNPDIPEGHNLLIWWETAKTSTFQTFTGSGGAGGSASNPLKTIAAVTDENLGMDAVRL